MPITTFHDKRLGQIVSGFCDNCMRIAHMHEPQGHMVKLIKRLRLSGWMIEHGAVYCSGCHQAITLEGQKHGKT